MLLKQLSHQPVFPDKSSRSLYKTEDDMTSHTLLLSFNSLIPTLGKCISQILPMLSWWGSFFFNLGTHSLAI